MNTRQALRHAVLVAALTVAGVVGGCASVPAGGSASGTPAAVTSIDPWESFNRKVYAFNDAIDTAVLKPLATAYRDWVPQLVRTGVSNVLGNIGDVWSTANNLLQGKGQVGLEMGMRVLTNTLFGLGGLLDPATEMGLTRRAEDFGQTLGYWGLGPGPYLVLPLLGPSTVRDSAGLVVDKSSTNALLPLSSSEQYGMTALQAVHVRAGLLSAGKLMDEVALDRYSFLRDAYLANRLDAVYDGAPPMQAMEDPGADEPPPPAPAASAPRK